MLLKKIKNTIDFLKTKKISNERKQILQPLINYIQSKVSENKNVNLNFICTHNSRRSHLSQVWAQAVAHYFNVKNVHCYSGGTEATTLYPIIVQTLEQVGFEINKLSESGNKVYSIKYAENEHPVIGFSKIFDNLFNPKNKFAAIMTCSHANANCPFIPGAEKRIPIEYEDPKEFDNTPQQKEKYQERSNQIAVEMLYVFSQIKIN
ncbi:protein-tyrosine-phosphatase [Lutibacter profundi]|uniref:Protein-tyrosine-phosphatase n=1 Tax=Lutibacter profundi TaxID=1622118 RepID=A0A0X8G6Q3_9FLAO|nr:protein-tyrosine-phosphatase [Lutibacter profundi]AMC11101.1 protein-tyrosine-phosphatase [Lutibacter profundi]